MDDGRKYFYRFRGGNGGGGRTAHLMGEKLLSFIFFFFFHEEIGIVKRPEDLDGKVNSVVVE